MDLNRALIEFVSDDKLSVRAANCCFNSNIISIGDLLRFYMSGGSFDSLRNAGRKTSSELDKFCKQTKNLLTLKSDHNEFASSLAESNPSEHNNISIHLNHESIMLLDSPENYILDLYPYIDNEKKLLLESAYKDLIEYFVAKGITLITETLYSIGYEEFIKSYLYSTDRKLLGIRNIGKIKHIDTILFKKMFKNEVYDILCQNNGNPPYIDDITTQLTPAEQKHARDFYEKHGHLPMLWILEQHIKLLNNKMLYVAKSSIPIFSDYQHKNYEDIGKELKITRERVRQIRYSLWRFMFDRRNINPKNEDKQSYHILKLFNSRINWKYYLQLMKEEKSVHQYSSILSLQIELEKSTLSPAYFLQIIAIVFPEKFTLLGGIEKAIRSTKWKCSYLIANDLDKLFDFEQMKHGFQSDIPDSSHEYRLDLVQYVKKAPYWRDLNSKKIDEVVLIVKDILRYEFSLETDRESFIILPSNKKPKPGDIVFEILKKNNKPMHLSAIYEEFLSLSCTQKFHITSPAKLRSFIHANKHITHIGRQSLYALKEWSHIKTGTIREAIVEFLTSRDSPQTYSAITKYVLKYFPGTNHKSVRTSIGCDKKSRFIIFSSNLVGLASKNYPNYDDLSCSKTKHHNSNQLRLFDFD
jgi:hypothetical protein